jgi:peptide/nickel transport system permease protein
MSAAVASEEGYAARVWRRFGRDIFARAGLGVVLVLSVMAAFAPFLANSHALVRFADGHWSSPALRSMEMIEWRFLLYFLLVLTAWLLRRRWAGHPRAGFVALVLALALIEGLLRLVHPVNDPSNDRTRPAAFKLLAPIPYSPIETTDAVFVAPGGAHWCGTDSTGRDIASRMVHGARTSLSIGFVSQGVALLIGLTLGGVAGYFRGWADIAIFRFVEIVECFPSLLLILVVISMTNSANNMFVIMVVIGLTSWTGMARLVRGEFLRLSVQPFTQAAQALGAGHLRIIVRHLLPNALGPIGVVATFGVASAILIESSLSFLGFGMQAPTPSWGDILSESRRYIDFAWWLALFPGCAILLTVTSYNFVGEGLRDAVDPRLQVK